MRMVKKIKLKKGWNNLYVWNVRLAQYSLRVTFSNLLGSYFYIIDISYDKMHFTSIWVNLSRFKIIITSVYIEVMKITQELLKKS